MDTAAGECVKNSAGMYGVASLGNQVKNIARELFEGARGSHDWEHTSRVCGLCKKIGPLEGADMNVLVVAAYLHDIGRCWQDRSNGRVCHAEKGAEMAAGIVLDLPFSDVQKENIVHCVRSHRFRENQVPETIEAKVLYDADKLDAIGAIGVARAYLFAGELGAMLHNPYMDAEDALSYSKNDTGYREYKVKLSRIRDNIMTKEGRRIADDRHAFMETFFEQFLDEYKGER